MKAEEYRQIVKSNYWDLLEAARIGRIRTRRNLGLCFAQCKIGDAVNGPRIMVVGRSLNGADGLSKPWRTIARHELNEFIDDISKERPEGLLYTGMYNCAKSPFLRMIRKFESHSSMIAWTNLYKLTPKDGGNPCKSLRICERDICQKILTSEIDYYRPELIVFLTGIGWAKEVYELPSDMKRIPYNHEIYVSETNGICVACHPQCKPENEIFRLICSLFRL